MHLAEYSRLPELHLCKGDRLDASEAVDAALTFEGNLMQILHGSSIILQYTACSKVLVWAVSQTCLAYAP